MFIQFIVAKSMHPDPLTRLGDHIVHLCVRRLPLPAPASETLRHHRPGRQAAPADGGGGVEGADRAGVRGARAGERGGPRAD